LARWPEPFEGDVRDLDFADLDGKIDLVSGGPPCQPFSMGGRHLGNADKRDMWPEAVRAVRQIRPRAFIFENVKGLTRQAFANYFSYVLLQLSYPSLARKENESWDTHLSKLQRHHTGRPEGSEEYRVVFKLLNAADYGVPQKRERVIFVGFRSDVRSQWSFPKPGFSQDALLWSQCGSQDYWERHRIPLARRVMDARTHARGMSLSARPEEAPWRTIRDVIHDLPDPELDTSRAPTVANHKFQAGAKIYPGHTGSALDEPSKTLKAGVHGVPGGENMLIKEDGGVRYFTVRESARLQCFPDNFVFHGAWTEAMRQLGNAVPVDLAAIVAKSVKKHLQKAARNAPPG
jgi:DNA (cytosine-5)-methyltransferase 1